MSDGNGRTGRRSAVRLQEIAGALQPVNAGVAQSVVNRILDLVRTAQAQPMEEEQRSIPGG